MPLSEFLRLAIEKLESSRKKTCSTDLSSPRADNDLVGNSTTTRVGKFGEVESILNDTSLPVVPSGNLDLSQNDEMVPWLSYPVVDDGMQDYCAEFLPEISGVTADRMLAGNSSDQAVGNLDTFKVTKARPLCSWLTQQGQTSDPSLGSGVSNVIRTNNNVGNDCQSRKMERQNIPSPSSNSSLLNFSNFSRPAKFAKANLTNSNGVPPPGSTCRCNSKSSLNERLNSSKKDMDFHVPSAPTVVKSRQLVANKPKKSFLAGRTENLIQETSMKNSSIGVLPDSDRSVEPVVACSSVGSGNSVDRVSCEQTHNSKRKFCDIEEFECHSEDNETESVGVKKQTPARGGIGSKRSRAAEVHNLSERRRRDRINEKMRALQELIPNCNKADKASMLDEAIEYLKNLQLQLQMMSTGAGLCMPPMMFHPGTQHMHPSHVHHFSPMGVRMAMGFGIGMPEMNGGSPQYPFFPMQRAHFPASTSGPTNFSRIPGPNLPVYGNPGQGLNNSVPRAPLVPLNGRPMSRKLNSEDLMKNKNSHFKNNAEAGSLINQRSNQSSDCDSNSVYFDIHCNGQLSATNEVLDLSGAARDNKQATDVGSTSALTYTTATDTSKETGSE